MRLAASAIALACAMGLSACATNNDDYADTGAPAPVASAQPAYAAPPPPAYAPPPPAYVPPAPPPAPAYTGERG